MATRVFHVRPPASRFALLCSLQTSLLCDSGLSSVFSARDIWTDRPNVLSDIPLGDRCILRVSCGLPALLARPDSHAFVTARTAAAVRIVYLVFCLESYKQHNFPTSVCIEYLVTPNRKMHLYPELHEGHGALSALFQAPAAAHYVPVESLSVVHCLTVLHRRSPGRPNFICICNKARSSSDPSLAPRGDTSTITHGANAHHDDANLTM
jgi:hypothetical protein